MNNTLPIAPDTKLYLSCINLDFDKIYFMYDLPPFSNDNYIHKIVHYNTKKLSVFVYTQILKMVSICLVPIV